MALWSALPCATADEAPSPPARSAYCSDTSDPVARMVLDLRCGTRLATLDNAVAVHLMVAIVEEAINAVR